MPNMPTDEPDYSCGRELVDSENTVMLRTFSKIYGLSALRLGWAYAPANIINVLNRIRGPFNVSTPAIAAGSAAARDTAFTENARQFNTQWLEWLSSEIGKLGLKVYPSIANFILVAFPQGKYSSTQANEFLMERGLIPREVANYGLPDCLRLSIGLEEDNRAVARTLGGFPESRNVSSSVFDRITIIGLGLIGSSIARAVHERGLAKTIVGCDHNEISLAYARKHGFIDTAESDPPKAVAGSDLVILATPPSTLADIAQSIAPHLKPGAIVMDVCSVKQPAIDAIAPHIPPGVDFIPAHPIAGSEQSGIAAGRADLFERKQVIITPKEPLQDEPCCKPSPNSGRPWARASRPCRRICTT